MSSSNNPRTKLGYDTCICEGQKNELDRYLEDNVEDDDAEFDIFYWLFLYLLYHQSLHLVLGVEF